MSKRQPKTQRPDRTQPKEGASDPVRTFERWLSPRWAAPAFFLAFTIVYFVGFVFSSDVMVGLDTRQEFHLGKQPAGEKLADLAPEEWDRYLGGTPVSGFRQPKYFPLYPVYLFTTFHRYLGWRYFFATFFAGWFTYLCVRGMRLRHTTATLAGIAYASSPVLLTFIYPGQEGKMLVIGILPLMVWALYRIVDERKPVFTFVLAAGVAAGIYTPHLQMLYYALIGLGILFVVRLVQTYLDERDVRLAAIRSGLASGGIVLGLAVGAVGTFPAYKYTKTESRRAGDQGQGVSIEYAQSWSLHPEEIASTLLVPEFVHFFKPETRENFYWGRNALKLNAEYIGIAAVFLAVLAALRLRGDPRVLPMLLLGVITLTFSMGPHTPVFAFFYHFVPGMNVLRTPGMIAFLFAFPAVILAAFEIERLLDGEAVQTRALATVGGVFAIFLAAAAAAPAGVVDAWTGLLWPDIPADKAAVARQNVPHLGTGAALGLLWVAGLVLLVYLRRQNRVSAGIFVIALLPVILGDTWRIDKQFLQYVDPDRFPDPEVYLPQTVGILEADTGYHRTWVPAADVMLPEDVDLLTVDYHEPFIVRRYDRVTEHLIEQLQRGRFDAAYQLLNVLNVRYVTITAQKVGAVLQMLALPEPEDEKVVLKPGVEAVSNERSVYLFRNTNARPFFYLVPNATVAPTEDAALAAVTNLAFDPAATVVLEDVPKPPQQPPLTPAESVSVETFDARDGVIRLTVSAEHPRTLVVSQNYHPYWNATVDGRPADIHRANFVWQAVSIPPGRHTVEITYHDSLAKACRWISLLSTVGLLAGLVLFSRRDAQAGEDA